MTNIEALATQVQASATQLGINKFDIYGSTVDETSVQVDHGEPKQVKASNRSSVTVRVWNADNIVGTTSTTAVDSQGLELALRMAQEASAFGPKEHGPDFSPEAIAPLVMTERSNVPAEPVDHLLETLIRTEKGLLEAHPAIMGVPYNGIAQREIEHFYLNSDGASRHETMAYASIHLYTKTEETGKRSRSAGTMKLGHGLADLDVMGCLQETVDKTISYLDYTKIPSGTYRVVFSPDAFLSLLGAFSNLFNAQNILDRQSLSTPESLGTQIGTPCLCVFDDALHPDNILMSHFDGEGTPTRRVPLIENGVLTGLLHSAGTAKRLGASPTGHTNMGAKVTVSPHFYHVFSGDMATSSYDLEAADNVVLIDELEALHAGVKALQGSFSLPFKGWLINQGKCTSIEAATVAGDFREVLQSIILVEPELEITPSGVCPRIWVEGLTITGE